MTRDRLYYRLSLPTLRSGRTRTLALRNVTPTPAVDWTNVSFLNGTPFDSNVVQMLGFTNQLTIWVYRNTGANITIVCNVCAFANKTGMISSTTIGVGGRVLVSVSPGNYVFFSFTASRSVVPFTVSVTNNQTGTVIDSFTAQAL
jgi:hypothetical protein